MDAIMQESKTILQAIARRAATIPDKTAIVEADTGRACTFGELWRDVRWFANSLAAAGVKRDFGDGFGTRVVIRCAQSIDYVVAFLAVQLAGGVAVPVEKGAADARVIEIMEEMDSGVFISAKPLASRGCLHIPLEQVVGVSGRPWSSAGDTAHDVESALPDCDALALILFTTGTTGKSKGVMHSHKSSTARIRTHDAIYSVCGDGQVWLIPSPLSHMNGMNKMYLCLCRGFTLVLLSGYSMAKAFFDAIPKYGVNCLNFMSAAAEMYVRTFRETLLEIRDQIDCVNLSASTFTMAQIDALRDIFRHSRIIHTYGATEVVGCAIDRTSGKYAANCVGLPDWGTEVVFFDEEKKEIIQTDKKKPGLFAMSSDARMIGYWRNPGLTASVTKGEYIVLSDYGYLGEDGMLYYLGRADDVIVSGSYKIAPLEIEDAANTFGGIRECACVPAPDPIMGDVPKLFVVMNDGWSFDYSEIYKHLRSALEATKLPRYIEEISEIPKINNKINRKELRNR
jgi:long-chain acyl-CoA synthetase